MDWAGIMPFDPVFLSGSIFVMTFIGAGNPSYKIKWKAERNSEKFKKVLGESIKLFSALFWAVKPW